MTCIYLAIKIHSPTKVDMESILSTGHGLITAQHIEAMELSIMKVSAQRRGDVRISNCINCLTII